MSDERATDWTQQDPDQAAPAAAALSEPVPADGLDSPAPAQAAADGTPADELSATHQDPPGQYGPTDVPQGGADEVDESEAGPGMDAPATEAPEATIENPGPDVDEWARQVAAELSRTPGDDQSPPDASDEPLPSDDVAAEPQLDDELEPTDPAHADDATEAADQPGQKPDQPAYEVDEPDSVPRYDPAPQVVEQLDDFIAALDPSLFGQYGQRPIDSYASSASPQVAARNGLVAEATAIRQVAARRGRR